MNTNTAILVSLGVLLGLPALVGYFLASALGLPVWLAAIIGAGVLIAIVAFSVEQSRDLGLWPG